ncbi:MAG: putative DNA binding domain-containing protein [Treponema sp.]|nr:putative DNA binding domain-containing protein [Treponema sp.]MCL2272309.1 putative DNA binding domain-containing protein [Treponema sp.]
MNSNELSDIIRGGESSTVQLKERLPHQDSFANELIAFSNSKGGIIIIGVNDKTGELNGLSFSEIQQTNQQIVNIASQKVYPPVFLTTETVTIDNNQLIIVNVDEGLSKPYKDSNGTIYLKNGADKRKVTSNDEIARLLRESRALFAEEMLIKGSSINDIDADELDLFLYRKYKKKSNEFIDDGISIEQILENLNLAQNGAFLLAGLLLFSSRRHFYLPQFSIQCVSVDGSIIENTFKDNEAAFEGTISHVYKCTIDFIKRNMKKIPETNGFNSLTKWEIPYEVFEELLVNALVHRDYFISSTIKVLIFTDRVEIISPGKLPNSLSIENIKNGVSVIRNNILLSSLQYILPYKGLGTGIRRSYSLYPDIIMENKIKENQFQVIIKRPLL